jgi:TolA-binding protein
MKRVLLAAVAVGMGVLASAGSAVAQPVEYVRVCDAYGSQWAYIPGTETCLNMNTGETRVQTESGTRQAESELSSRVSGTEGGLQETNTELAKTNDRLADTNKRVDALEQSYSDLEQRFENAFQESLDGVAIAMALSSPDLVAGERFAMKINLGTYNGSNAFGFSVAGVLARTDFGRVTMSGGVATTGSNTGGNVGMQLSW